MGGGRDIAAVQETGQGSGSPSRGLETWEELHTRRRMRRLKAVTNMFHSAATLARPRSRNLRMRVPAGKADEAVDLLKALATEVESEVSASQDVTDEYVNNQARLRNLGSTENSC